MAPANRVSGLLLGEKGRILWVVRWEAADGEAAYYLCELDRTGPTYTAALLADELERDD